MGAPEEAGKAVSGAIEALKSTPVILAILIFNVLFMALSAYSYSEGRAAATKIIHMLLDRCGPAAKPEKLGDKDARIRLNQGKETPQGQGAPAPGR